MSEGTQDIDLFPVGLHVCLLCALHTAISSQTLHGILHKGSTCWMFCQEKSKCEQLWNLLLHMELLMLVQLCQRGKGLVTNGTKELHSTTTLRRRFLLRYSSGWTLQVWLQLLAQIPPRQVFLLQTTFSGLQLILRAWGCSIWSTWFFHTSSGNLNIKSQWWEKQLITREKKCSNPPGYCWSPHSAAPPARRPLLPFFDGEQHSSSPAEPPQRSSQSPPGIARVMRWWWWNH